MQDITKGLFQTDTEENYLTSLYELCLSINHTTDDLQQALTRINEVWNTFYQKYQKIEEKIRCIEQVLDLFDFNRTTFYNYVHTQVNKDYDREMGKYIRYEDLFGDKDDRTIREREKIENTTKEYLNDTKEKTKALEFAYNLAEKLAFLQLPLNATEQEIKEQEEKMKKNRETIASQWKNKEIQKQYREKYKRNTEPEPPF